MIFLLFIFLICCFSMNAQQNLVADPGFEKVFMEAGKPQPQSKEWLFFKEGEIGFLHPKSTYWSPMKNPHGSQLPKAGEAMAWLKTGGVTSANSNNYGDIKRYYFLTELKEPMIAGLTYYVEGFVSFADKANCAIDQFGFYFTDNKPDSTLEEFGKDYIAFLHPQVKYLGEIITDSENWTRISGFYTAKGGERWLMVGHFGAQHFFRYKIYKRRSHFMESYYYLDEVSVLKPPLADSVRPLDLSLPELAFSIGSARLSGQAMQALDSLGKALETKKVEKFRIAGHTDNTGSDALNLRLSRQRAQAVADYLKEMFPLLKAVEFEAKGFGSTRPAGSNRTEEGRRQNRRVEIWVEVPNKP